MFLYAELVVYFFRPSTLLCDKTSLAGKIWQVCGYCYKSTYSNKLDGVN